MWPSSRLEATRIVVPVGCLLTPLKVQHPQYALAAVQYDPVRCKNSNCGAILNPWCQVDFRSKLWTCPFCLTRNHFPPQYAEHLSEQNLPAELIPQYTTLEYELPNRRAGPPVFLFVVDCCLDEEALEELKDSLQQCLNLLPDEALVGLVTFGTNVQLHELGYTECPKSFVFRGNKAPEASKVSALLGIRPGGPSVHSQSYGQSGSSGPTADQSAIGRFLVPVSECGFSLESVLDDLSRDPWPVKQGHRPNRATGTAMSVAVGLLETAVPHSGARIMTFVGGPCTSGPGRIVATELTETMRSHHDLIRNNAPLYDSACEHYESLAARCVKNSHVIDIFAMSLDQVGLLEMKRCVEKTGGLVVLADNFGQSVFKESFQRVFRRHPDSSPEWSLNVSENEVGQGSTYAWAMGGISPSTTIGFYFEIVNKEDNPLPAGKCHHIQFVTTYQHSSGAYRMRVTTLGGPWHGDTQNSQPVAREELPDIMRWIDRSLIRLTSKFADYREDDPLSLRMLPEFSIYPQFMFHLRRSQFLQTGNMSPDESAYHRMILMQENTSNSLWRDKRYQDDPKHTSFKNLLKAPGDDALLILENRFPAPRLIFFKDHLPRTFTKPKEMIQSLMISNGSFQAQLHRHGLSRGNWSHSAKTEKHGTGENDNLQTEKRLPIKKDGNSVKLPAGDIIPKFVQYDRHGAKAPKAHCLPDFTHTYESEHAALRIQKLWRGVSARMEVHLPGGAKEQWMATKIQRHYRMYSVRREYLLYKEVHAMMTDLQEKHGRLLVRVARGMLGRVKARHFRESRTNACIRIQTCFRGWYQRERGKVRKKIYYKWKAMTIQRVWRGHWGRQVFRATRFRVNAAKHLRTDPKAQWGIVQVGMRLHKVRHDFRKLDGLINAHNQAAWHQLFKKGPRVLAEGSEGTLLSKRGPSVGLRTRLYSHALFQLSRDGLSKSIFPDLGIVIYMRKFELLGYGHVPPSHASPLGETHMFHTGSKFDTIDDPTLLYLVIAIYEQGTNMIVEIFDPETHFECVPIRINAKELQAMCRKNPSMLEGGKRYVDLRKWIARSLYIRKRPQSLCLCCPPLERARRYIKHELAATHISRIARGYMSKCRVKRIVFALREKKRQRSLISKLRKPI
eukprot:g2125.t1